MRPFQTSCMTCVTSSNSKCPKTKLVKSNIIQCSISAPPYAAQPYGTATVVIQPPVSMMAQSFREVPVRATCPSCHADIMTTTHCETGTFAWVICFVLAIIGYVDILKNVTTIFF